MVAIGTTEPPVPNILLKKLFRTFISCVPAGTSLNGKSFANDSLGMEGEEWYDMVAIGTAEPPVPDILLKKLFCSCKRGCASECGCRKLGLLIQCI